MRQKRRFVQLVEDRGLRVKPDTDAQLFNMVLQNPKTKQKKKNAAWHQDTNISIVYVSGAGSVSMVWMTETISQCI